MRRVFILISSICVLLSTVGPLAAQNKGGKKGDGLVFDLEDSTTLAYLDTVNLKKKVKINDYSLIGVHYGVSLNNVSFNPTRPTAFVFNTGTYGITFTHYEKMFGFMPYFGYQFGVFHSTEAYQFKENKDTGTIPIRDTLTYESSMSMEILEVPILAHFHLDAGRFKLMANLGIYGGWRYNIHRGGGTYLNQDRKDVFLPFEHRFDYGLKGGAGIGLILDPFEIHINAMVRYSWSSLYEPDYYNKYYYRFAYPFDVVITAGLQFQLGRRTGKTRPQLRKEAREMVYGEPVEQ